MGVVTALILSILFPIAIDGQILEVEDTDWFGTVSLSNQQTLALVAYILYQVATACSVFVLVAVANMYTQLSFHMPTTSAKLYYIEHIRWALPLLVALKNCSLIFAGMAYVFDSVSTHGGFGLFSLLSAFGAGVPVVWLVGHMNAKVSIPYLKREATALLQRGSVQKRA